mgnify:CR=1 FL=1
MEAFNKADAEGLSKLFLEKGELVDENGNVVTYIKPSPGVNLAPLVGQHVAVRGAKGYMPEYKQPYIVASEARPRLATTPPTSNDAVRQ